jgi:nicotinate-nucleotide--dimethylbenzimidazole phosphoribosyltransferase
MSHDGYRAVLVLGGIRSGKSEFAESLVTGAAEVRYVATAPASPQDPEWAARVAAHRDRRPAGWQTEEIGTDPGRLVGLLAETKPDQTVLVDDLGGWVTALLTEAGWAADRVDEPVSGLVDAVRGCAGRLVVVSPEVGLSVVPMTSSGRAFTDALGSANQTLAGACDAVVLVVAGQPSWLKRGTPAGPSLPTVLSAPARGLSDAPTILPTPQPVESSADVPVIGPGLELPIPDQDSAVAARDRLELLDVPGHGLGRLAEVVAFVAGVQGDPEPVPFRQPRVLLLHGVHEGGLAAGDQVEDWADRLRLVAEGGGPVGLLATQTGTAVQLIDLATAGLPAAAPAEHRDAVPAMVVEDALRYGWRLAESAVDAGTDLLVLAAGGPGQEAAAVAVIAATTGAEPAGLLPRVRRAGGRYDDNAWMVRCAAVRDALHRIRAHARQPKELLAGLAGADLAVTVGLMLGAAARRTPVLIDGPVGVAAGLLARDLASQSRLWLLLPDHGGHPATVAGADVLGVEPFAELKLGLGEGAGALAALPLLQAALLLSGRSSASPAGA